MQILSLSSNLLYVVSKVLFTKHSLQTGSLLHIGGGFLRWNPKQLREENTFSLVTRHTLLHVIAVGSLKPVKRLATTPNIVGQQCWKFFFHSPVALRNLSPSFVIARANSFSVIHVNLDIKI